MTKNDSEIHSLAKVSCREPEPEPQQEPEQEQDLLEIARLLIKYVDEEWPAYTFADPDLEREAGMNGYAARLLQAARNLSRR